MIKLKIKEDIFVKTESKKDILHYFEQELKLQTALSEHKADTHDIEASTDHMIRASMMREVIRRYRMWTGQEGLK